MAATCARCGVSSGLEELFQKERRTFSLRTRRVCPRCVQERRVREELGMHRWTLVALAGCAGGVALAPGSEIAGVALALAAFLLALVPATVLHEAGHALTARSLGLHSFGVVVGFGRVWWSGSVWGIPVEWRAVPAGAVTRAAHVRAEGARWRMALFAFAGPAANALAAAAAWPLLGALESRGPGWIHTVLSGWVAAHGLCALLNLIPFRHTNAFGLLASDGLIIWQALRSDAARVQEWLSGRFLMEAALAREAGRFEEGLEWVETGLRQDPGNAHLVGLRGSLQLDTGDVESARDVFQAQVASDLPPQERACALNNLAWCDFLSAREERLDEALQCSEEAIDQLGWLPPIQNTRAAVLLWAERADEALPLARASLKAAESPRDRAAVLCVIALAQAALGERDDAKRALEQARALDAEGVLLARATATVG